MGRLSAITQKAREAALRALGGERALVPPVYRYGNFRQGITGSEQQVEPSRLLVEGFRATQATAARAVADRVSDLEFVVQRKQLIEGVSKWVDEGEHPLRLLLDRPNRVLTRRQLLKLTSYWLTQTGKAYWLIVTQGAGRPIELWPMSPRNIEEVSGTAEPVEAFVFHGQAGETRYAPSEVIWFFDPDPADPFSGVGIVGPQATEFDTERFAAGTMRTHYQRDAVPKTVLTAQPDAQAPNQEQLRAFSIQWQNRYNQRNGEMVGVPAFLPSGFDVRELGDSNTVESAVRILEWQRDQLLMANGVPRSILGDVVDANRAAADTNRLVFDRHRIQPQVGLIADALTLQLAEPSYGAGIRVTFEDFIDEDDDLRLREERQDLETKVRSINQVRADRGIDSVDWGDLPVGTFGDQPYDPEMGLGDDRVEESDATALAPQGNQPPPSAENVEQAPQAGEGATGNGARAARTRRIRSRFTAEAQWSRLIQAETAYVPKAVRAMRAVFAAQRTRVLEELRAVDSVEGETARAYSRADWIDRIFEFPEFGALFDQQLTPVTLEAYLRAGENVLAGLEVRPVLDFDQLASDQIKAQGADLVSKVNATTKRRIRDQLAKGIEAGDSEEMLEKRIRRVFREASSSRARTIARTEIAHAITSGQLAGYEQSGVVTLKRWNTALDGKVRDSHEIDGQTVRVHEPFTLGDGEQASGPGVAPDGGRLSARNSINCRCFTTPVVEGV